MSGERAFALRIVNTLWRSGHLALLAGGCVRDELLGREPSDYDVATSATPAQIAGLFPRTSHVGAHFGVVLVRDGAMTVEVATFRTDGAYEDARRPTSVQFSTPKEDAMRRDFTVNALFLDVRERSQKGNEGSKDPAAAELRDAVVTRAAGGSVIDFVGGVRDLQSKVLRAVGDAHARLAEDHLRALRAVRLAAKLEFAIEGGTAEAIRRHAMELRGVSPERIGDECRQMFAHPTRSFAAGLLGELGLVAAMLGTPARGAAKRDGALLAQCAGPGERVSVGYAMLAWSHWLGVRLLSSEAGSAVKEFVHAAREGLCLSNEEATEMQHLAARLIELDEQWGSASVARRKRILQSKEVGNARRLFAVLAPAAAARVQREAELLAATPSGIAPEPLLTGDHLLAAGAKAGPRFKVVLDAVYDAQLEDKISTREEALAMGMGMF